MLKQAVLLTEKIHYALTFTYACIGRRRALLEIYQKTHSFALFNVSFGDYLEDKVKGHYS